MTLDQFAPLLTLLKEQGLSINQWKVLLKLKSGGDFMMSELAQECDFSTAACTVCIDRLEKKGLIQRKLDKADRRKVIVAIDLAGTLKISILSKKLSGV